MTQLTIATDAIVDFLVGLLNTPSPTGYAPQAIEYTRQAFAALNLPGLSLTITPKGALVISLPGARHDAPRGLTAHVDTLGLMVKEIKSSGRLKVTNLGGIVWGGIEFEGVTVRTQDGRLYRGSVSPVNASAHVNPKIRTMERNDETMEIRLDERVLSAEDVRALGIEVGDFVFVDPRVEVSASGFVRSRFLDDKAGVACIYGALLALRDAGLTPAEDVHILIANYEEVGHGGTSGLPDGLAELVAVDMAALGDGQTSDEFNTTICVKDSGGPYHYALTGKLRQIAEANGIPYKVDIYPFYSSDGTAYWRAGGSAQVALIGPGVDASHAYERTHREALEHSAHLLARYLLAE